MLLRQSVTVLNKEIKISLIWVFPKCVLQSLRVSELAHRGVLGGPSYLFPWRHHLVKSQETWVPPSWSS